MASGHYIALTLGNIEIDLSRSKETEEVNLLGVIRPAANHQVLLTHQTVNSLSPDLGPFFPNGLSISFKNALLAEQKSGSASTKLVAANIGAQINLSDIPVVGKLLPDTALTIDDLQLLMASDTLQSTAVGEINAIVPPGIAPLPPLLRKGVNYATRITLGGITFSFGSEPQSWGVSTPGGGLGDVAETPANTAPPTAWITINKSIGKLHIAEIGIRLNNGGTFDLLVDATIKLGKLTLSTLGLGLKFPLKGGVSNLLSDFVLAGLSLSYQSKNVSIAGAFMHQQNMWDGAFNLKLSKMQISAIGSYAKDQDGHPSVFIYASLQRPIGGPAFCFVEGLAATFGYNRNFIAPPVTQIAAFPLISAASGATGLCMTPAGMQTMITDIDEYIAPADGENFVGIGLKFSTYKVVNSFALLVVKFGDELAIDLLGESTYIAPSPKAKKRVASVELELVGTYHPNTETLLIRGQLTPASYVISPKCHLQGGFAIGNWFKTGDFVYTLGGYAKNYTIPSNYPQHVPKLGFLWQIDPEISIKGGGYWAVTPKHTMLGGYLIAAFTTDWVRASFEIDADFNVDWSPFHYSGSIEVTFSLEVRIDLLFCSEWVGFEISRGLSIWGPSFGGEVSISLAVATVHIHFGANPAPPPLLTGHEFNHHHLPQPATSGSREAKNPLVNLSIEDGLVKETPLPKSDPTQHTVYTINPKELTLITNSAVPSTALRYGAAETQKGGTGFEIVPMGVTYDGNTNYSKHTVTIKNENKEDYTKYFMFTPISKGAPTSMWQTTSASPDRIVSLDFGYEITPEGPHIGSAVGPIPESTLAKEEFTGKSATHEEKRLFGGEQHEAKNQTVTGLSQTLYNDLSQAFDFGVPSGTTAPNKSGLQTRLTDMGKTAIEVGTLSID